MYTSLIRADQLAALTASTAQRHTVILDCRHDLTDTDAGTRAFAAGHLPGAQFVHLDQVLSAAKTDADGVFRGRHPLPDAEDFAASLRQLGVNADTQVVAVDAHGGMFAARLWWMLRWIGHAAVAVLDGGIPAWQVAGYALSTEQVSRAAGNIQVQPSLVTQVSVAQVVANLESAERIVIDARAPDRFRGENETMDPVGGHIPGAKNRFFKDNLQADGSFKPAAQLSQEWAQLISDPARAIMQCGSGVTACHNLLALEVAGLHGAALYPGSWSEWCADPARPVAL
ncbi:sulfurtransferase [Undibacterium curvum]|uniref:sulfurtransferase n=1 Tax=Undibacterium curvum TaxID=2762294 RepID=UPI003D13C9D7